jgi:hypothetical protein
MVWFCLASLPIAVPRCPSLFSRILSLQAKSVILILLCFSLLTSYRCPSHSEAFGRDAKVAGHGLFFVSTGFS